MKWKVKRTIQDFYALRFILKNQYPEKLIPALPNETKTIETTERCIKDQKMMKKVSNELEVGFHFEYQEVSWIRVSKIRFPR